MTKQNDRGLDAIFNHLTAPNIQWDTVLNNIIDYFDCTTGTLHFLEPNTSILKLKAQKGIPDFLLPKVSEIPIGKGMAGIAAERQKPVEMCNLQTDSSGVARPAAKETKVEGSLAAPMMLDGKLFGTLGVAKPVPYDFTKQELEDIMKIGEAISKYITAA